MKGILIFRIFTGTSLYPYEYFNFSDFIIFIICFVDFGVEFYI
jgi:hypothetical protein